MGRRLRDLVGLGGEDRLSGGVSASWKSRAASQRAPTIDGRDADPHKLRQLLAAHVAFLLAHLERHDAPGHAMPFGLAGSGSLGPPPPSSGPARVALDVRRARLRGRPAHRGPRRHTTRPRDAPVPPLPDCDPPIELPARDAQIARRRSGVLHDLDAVCGQPFRQRLRFARSLRHITPTVIPGVKLNKPTSPVRQLFRRGTAV